LTLEDGPIGCPETSVQKYHPTLRKIPEERRSQNKIKLKSNIKLQHKICGSPGCRYRISVYATSCAGHYYQAVTHKFFNFIPGVGVNIQISSQILQETDRHDIEKFP
jgi:hypothetical protein